MTQLDSTVDMAGDFVAFAVEVGVGGRKRCRVGQAEDDLVQPSDVRVVER